MIDKKLHFELNIKSKSKLTRNWKTKFHCELITRTLNFYFCTFELQTRNWKIKTYTSGSYSKLKKYLIDRVTFSYLQRWACSQILPFLAPLDTLPWTLLDTWKFKVIKNDLPNLPGCRHGKEQLFANCCCWLRVAIFFTACFGSFWIVAQFRKAKR